jgi:hypothetical protein
MQAAISQKISTAAGHHGETFAQSYPIDPRSSVEATESSLSSDRLPFRTGGGNGNQKSDKRYMVHDVGKKSSVLIANQCVLEPEAWKWPHFEIQLFKEFEMSPIDALRKLQGQVV